MAFFDFMNILLTLPPAVAILIVSIGVSIATSLVYKYTTNQKLMREIKENVKRLQAEARATKEPAKAAEIQKEMMKRSMQQFNSSTNSMFITFIPLLMFFGWLGTHIAYSPLSVGEQFTTTMSVEKDVTGLASLNVSEGLQLLSESNQTINNGKAQWKLKYDKEGIYNLSYQQGSNSLSEQFNFSKDRRYYQAANKPAFLKPGQLPKESTIKQITIDLKPIHPFGNFTVLGWMPGWFITYIVFSLLCQMAIRKLFKIY